MPPSMRRAHARRRAAGRIAPLGVACLLALVAGGLLAGCRLPIQRGRWNVLVVLVDTLRADRLGAYGYQRETSPHFDALAAESHLFTAARAQAPCTYPSANSLLTSRYPARFLGQPDGGLGIPAGIPSLAEMLAARGWSTAAVSASAVVRATPGRYNPAGGFGRGFERFDESCEWKDADCVHEQAEATLDRLREPFFLYLHYLDPHAPYDPPRDTQRRFVTARSERRWIRRGNPGPISRMLYDGGAKVEYGQQDLLYLQQLYDAEVASFDQALGRLVEELRHRDLLDRTIVALVADHGESFLEHGDIKHCRSLYDTELHTPLLLRLPRQHAGSRIATQVQNLDLVPTLLDLLGEPFAERGLEGRTLVPLLEGREPSASDAEGADAEGQLAFGMMSSLRSVSDGRHKLIHDLRDGTWKLFDLQQDPGERHDLVSSERRTFVRLRTALLAWIARVEGAGGLQRAEEAEQRLRALGYL
jgi:arylsulfatase A-like enzyme